MADTQSHEEVPEDPKNPALRPFDYLDTESQNLVSTVQRRNLNFLQNDPSIIIANGMHIYYDGRGRILAAGAESLVEESSEESELDIIWGPGAEASVAKRLIESAPKIKHSAWITAQKVFSEIPANPTLTPAVIALLRSTIAKERECWEKLDALKTVQTYDSLLYLNMEAILTSMCSLAGITVVGEGTLTPAESGLSDLHPNLLWLRYNHQDEIKENRHAWDFCGPSIIIDRFRAKWDPILERLLPGRLDNKMEQYADRMQYLLDNDKCYSPN
ncbi:hypothetical protein CFAM422_002450 [Trichoderma lentiforme]|uniref:Uncharacterized protein n=1 Tax=Trichoderma lentiforme TaxID=1567552 RepID=A0A9P5CI60_9HYPO|nr:hypothetical protein CFAM422_002450 [Trichoderma lentiforme]